LRFFEIRIYRIIGETNVDTYERLVINDEKRPFLFRSVPLTLDRSGTNIVIFVENVDFCSVVFSARSPQTEQKSENTDVCATLRQARHLPQVAQEWAKTSMYVPRCPRHACTQWDKNGQKSPFSFQAVSGAGVQRETNIAVFEGYDLRSVSIATKCYRVLQVFH
jgi:hypothetical protein